MQVALRSFYLPALIAMGSAYPAISIATATVGKISMLVGGMCLTTMGMLGYSKEYTFTTTILATLGSGIGTFFEKVEPESAFAMLKTCVAVGGLCMNHLLVEVAARRYGCNPQKTARGLYCGVFGSGFLALTRIIPPSRSAISFVGTAIAGAVAGALHQWD